MRRALALFAVPALLAAGGACAQIAPGIRAPADVPMAVRHSLMLGCMFAVTGRPAPGLDGDFSMAGEGLHAAAAIPADLQPFVTAAGSDAKIAVLDAPGGEAWIAFSPAKRRCAVAPHPVDAQGMEAVAIDTFRPDSDWKPVKDKPGVFELKLRGVPTLRAWYQPASGDQPQMIIMEQKQ